MPTSTSNKGRHNWVCPAALRNGRPLDDVDVGLCVAGVLFIVVCVGLTFGVVGCGTELKFGVVGTGTGLTVGVVGTGTGTVVRVVGVGTGGGGGSVAGGGTGGPAIEVGPPTGPEQISPIVQHPIMSLLARAQ